MKKKKMFLLAGVMVAALCIFLSFFTTFTGNIIASAMENEWNTDYIFAVTWMPEGMNLKTFIQNEREQMQSQRAERIRLETEERRQKVSIDKMSSVADEVYKAFIWITETADTNTLSERYKQYENSFDLSELGISDTEQTVLETILKGIVKNASRAFDNNVHYALVSENQIGAVRECMRKIGEAETKTDGSAYIYNENFMLAAYTGDNSDFINYETDCIAAAAANHPESDYDYLCTYKRSYNIPEYGELEITVQAFASEDSAALVSVGIKEPEMFLPIYGQGNIRFYNPQGSVFEEAQESVIADVNAAVSVGNVFAELLTDCLKAGVHKEVYKELESEYTMIEDALPADAASFSEENAESAAETETKHTDSGNVTAYYNELKARIDKEFDKYKSYTPNRYLGLILEESIYMAMTSCDSELGYLADNIRLFLPYIEGFELKNSQIIRDTASDLVYTKMADGITEKLGSYGYSIHPDYAVHLEYEIKKAEFTEEDLAKLGEIDSSMSLKLDVLSAEEGIYITNFALSAPKILEDWFTCNTIVNSYQYDNLYVMVEEANAAVDQSQYDSKEAYEAAVENWLESSYPQYFSNTVLEEDDEEYNDDYTVASRRMRGIGNEISSGTLKNVIGAVNGIIDETADMAEDAAWSVSEAISQLESAADMAGYILKQEFNYQIGNYLQMELYFAKKRIEEGIDNFKESVSDAWHNLFD